MILLLLLTGFNMGMYIFFAMYKNLLMNIAITTNDAPMIGSGGLIYVYNTSSNKVVLINEFSNFWDYPIIFNKNWYEYNIEKFNSQCVVQSGPREFYTPQICSYQKNFTSHKNNKNIHQSKIINYVAVGLASLESLVTIFFVWYSYYDPTHTTNTKWSIFYVMMFVLFPLFVPFLLMIINMQEIYDLIRYDVPFNKSILIMSAFLVMTSVFGIIGSSFYKGYHSVIRPNMCKSLSTSTE